MYLFKKGFYLTFFPKKFNKSIVGVRGVIVDKDKYLLVKRASNDRHNPNKWEFPGGSIEVNENVQDSLKREIKEELNLSVNKVSSNCFVTFHDIPKNNKSVYKGFRRYVFFYTCGSDSFDRIKLSMEHSDYIWVTLDEVCKLTLTEDTILFFNSIMDRV